MIQTIRVADLTTRWGEIVQALRTGKQEFFLIEGQASAVIVDSDRYRQLVALAEREELRQRVLELPMAGSTSQADWDTGFVALEQVSTKFDGFSDDDLDALFSEVLAEVRTTGT